MVLWICSYLSTFPYKLLVKCFTYSISDIQQNKVHAPDCGDDSERVKIECKICTSKTQTLDQKSNWSQKSERSSATCLKAPDDFNNEQQFNLKDFSWN